MGVIPTPQELSSAIERMKITSPEFGVKRIVAAIKEQQPDWEVSEKRCRRLISLGSDAASQSQSSEVGGASGQTRACNKGSKTQTSLPGGTSQLVEIFREFSALGAAGVGAEASQSKGRGEFSFGFGGVGGEGDQGGEEARRRGGEGADGDDDDDDEGEAGRGQGGPGGKGGSSGGGRKQIKGIKVGKGKKGGGGGKKRRSGLAALFQAHLRGGRDSHGGGYEYEELLVRQIEPPRIDGLDMGVTGGYVPDSCPGCHVAFLDADWVVGVEPYNPAELGLDAGDDAPDISIDPSSGLLSVVNTSAERVKAFYLSVGHNAVDGCGNLLSSGEFRDESGEVRRCITLVLVVSPMHIMDACFIQIPSSKPGKKSRQQEGFQVDLSSDVTEVGMHPDPSSFDASHVYDFPLGGPGPYLCSQGACGQFTHYYSATLHAIDLECPVGTPVLSVADGTVISVKDESLVGGIHVQNLFQWNSVLVEMAGGVLVEYVHIKAHSARVKEGDKVLSGDVVCETGDVGFCPRPHLHIQMHKCAAKDHNTAATMRFAFKSAEGSSYFPIAGQMYSAKGPVSENEALWGIPKD